MLMTITARYVGSTSVMPDGEEALLANLPIITDFAVVSTLGYSLTQIIHL